MTREIYLFRRRLTISLVIVAVLTGFLLVRLIYLQTYQHRLYTTLSEQNQFELVPIEPNRGLIYDRNGILLADNLPVFSLDVTPDRIADIDATITALQQIIPITPDEIDQFHQE